MEVKKQSSVGSDENIVYALWTGWMQVLYSAHILYVPTN